MIERPAKADDVQSRPASAAAGPFARDEHDFEPAAGAAHDDAPAEAARPRRVRGEGREAEIVAHNVPPTLLEQAYESARPQTLLGALYRTYEHSGFTMAGSVAFSFVLALFPFCIFIGALAGVFGGRDLAEMAIRQLFEVLPAQVAGTLAPQINAVIGQTRIDLITIGGAIALFFATNGIETLRNALNYAYREQETRPYPLCLLISASFVIFNAIGSLMITGLTVIAPTIASEFEPEWLRPLHEASWWDPLVRYTVAGLVIASLLLVAHKFLAAGKRTLEEILPGVIISTFLWLSTAALYSYYLSFADYTRFYAGLSQIMVALIFFQVTAIIIILGAELNRGLMQLRRYGYIPDKD